MATFRFRLTALGLLSLTLALVATAAAGAPQQAELKQPAVFKKPLPESIEDLKAIQEHVKAVVAKVMPAVVNVKIGSQGSGVVITEDGYVLTAGHVSGVPGKDCTLTFADGKTVKGKSLGQNKGADSGLIKIMTEGKYPFVEMGKSGDVKKDQWCIAIGHPGGLKQGRSPPVRVGRVLTPVSQWVTTDCTLVGGDSGGPLFDMDGKVIGIHSRIGNPITSNMHVPVDIFRSEWDRLVKGESFGGAPGGGKGGPKTPPSKLSGLEFDGDAKDLKISKVENGSPAAMAGLKVGDVITGVNGKKVATAEDWRREIGTGKAGGEVSIEIRRGNETLTLKATLDKGN